MKKILKLSTIIGMVVLGCIGCSSKKSLNEEIVLKNGILSWNPQEQAEYYEVSLGESSIACQEEQMNLSKLCETEGEYEVSVSMVLSSGKKQTIGTLDIIAKELTKPAISVVKDDSGEAYFIWKAQEEAGGYSYDFNDGCGSYTAEAGEDGICRVVIPGNAAAMFTVSARETSKENVFYIGSTVSCKYVGEVLYDIMDLAKTPFYKVCDGTNSVEMLAGTTLPTGIYNLEVVFRVTNTEGQSVIGDGGWGRRIVPSDDWGMNFWFCENDVKNTDGTFASANTLKAANETISYTMPNMKVNKYGEISITLIDFQLNELLIIEDIIYEGKSVMADSLPVHDAREKEIFDVETLKNYLAVFNGAGVGYSAATADKSTLSVPMNVKDGTYEVEVNYQIMTDTGAMVSGNGVWGRSIACVNVNQLVYYCEYPVAEGVTTRGVPYSTQMLTDTFSVKVKNGAFEMILNDFSKGEIFAVHSIKQLSDGIPIIDIAKLLENSKYVYVGDGDWIADSLAVMTTKTGKREQVELEITYITVDQDGYSLVGNGLWGRRYGDDTDALHFICATPPHEAYLEAAGTINGTSPVTAKVTVTLNKKGKFYLLMSDFSEGDMFIVTDVKYQGESILAK